MFSLIAGSLFMLKMILMTKKKSLTMIQRKNPRKFKGNIALFKTMSLNM